MTSINLLQTSGTQNRKEYIVSEVINANNISHSAST